MVILGVNAYHGDGSAVLLRDGMVVAAVKEEVFLRIKHWAGFTGNAIHGRLLLYDVLLLALYYLAMIY